MRALSRIATALALALALPVGAWAQSADRTFRRIPDDAGLSHNSVHAIHQDRAGFLWVGTADGLNRFDGYGFRVYRHADGDTTTLSSNLIWDIVESRDGTLWIATGAGVDRYDVRHDRFARVRGPFDATEMSLWRTRLHEARDGTLRAATPAGLFRLTSAGFEPSPLDTFAGGVAIRELAEDGDGELWGRLQDGRIMALTGRRMVHPRAPGVGALLFDHRGTLHTTLDRIARASGTTPGTTALLETEDGTVWHGTTAGLVAVDTLGRPVSEYHLARDRQGYIFDYVQALFEDRSGTLWVGTSGGLVRSDPHAKAFRHLGGDPDHPARLSASAVSAVSADADAVWAGTLGSGLNRIDRRTGRIDRWQHRGSAGATDPRDVIWALHRDRSGALWIGAGAGLLRFDEAGGRPVPWSLPGSPGSIQVIAEDATGVLWLLGAGRLVRLDSDRRGTAVVPLGEVLGTSSPGPRPVLESLLVARDGTVWIGAGSNSLLRVDPVRLSVERVAIATGERPVAGALAIWDLHEDVSGTIWVGMGSGLGRYDPADGRFRLFSTADGLPGAVVFSIEEATDGSLWLGTNQGIARVTRAGDGITVRPFALADGTGSLEFNRRASFVDAAGEFYFGGVSGLTRFFPSAIRDNPIAPPVVLTAIQSIGPDGTRRHGSGPLELPYRENTVSVEFASLSFTNPGLNRYRYRLDGVDPGWVEAGTRRYARYAGLAPGHYELAVMGSNEDGVWSASPATLAVTILPPFWATRWFRAIALALLTAGAVAAYRAHVARLLAVERLRLRIAGDLHDDLASDLTGIALLGESVQLSQGLPDAERETMARITDAARRLSRDVRDIVWAVDPGHDRLADLAHHLREVTSALLADVPHRFEVAGMAADMALSMQARRQVLLVLKEALHNVRRHAEATQVHVRISVGASDLTLSIEDDGRGFDAARLSHRFGLDQLEGRARAVGGTLQVQSTPGDGTRVTLRVPLRGAPRSQRMA